LSRQKSGRGASPAAAKAPKRGAAAAPRGGARGVYVQAPKSDIFVVLLSISLGAIFIGCLLLLLVWGKYDYKTSVSALANPHQANPILGSFEKLNKIPLVIS
jgi:hypothetical protein